MKQFRYFTESEIVNPVFDGCPAKSWSELPSKVAINLENVLTIAEEFRKWLNKPLKITSSYRPDSKGSAHAEGKAVDLQIKDCERDINLHKNCINWFLGQNYVNTRVFLEYQGRGMWIHIDTNFKKTKKPEAFIMYPQNNKMQCESYSGVTPLEKA